MVGGWRGRGCGLFLGGLIMFFCYFIVLWSVGLGELLCYFMMLIEVIEGEGSKFIFVIGVEVWDIEVELFFNGVFKVWKNIESFWFLFEKVCLYVLWVIIDIECKIFGFGGCGCVKRFI